MSSSSDDETNMPSANPDADLETRRSARQNDKHRAGSSELKGSQTTRKNPFSFKYFLKNDLHGSNAQNTGARPKVYTNPISNPESTYSNPETNVYPRNPVELPDFVQDHLVMEQCYLNHDAASQPIVKMESLPDFALNSMEPRTQTWNKDSQKGQSANPGELSLDLTGSLRRSDRCQAQSSASNIPGNNSSDPSTTGRRNDEPHGWSGATGFPFDLQLPPAAVDADNSNNSRSGAANGEADVTKTLPDFLIDDPIHNRSGPALDASYTSGPSEQVNQRLLLENERLRREQEISQRQLSEQSRRIQSLQSELASIQSVDHEEMTNLEKTIEQVEDNLKRSTRRAVNAEGTVTSLKHEIKELKTELAALRLENEELKQGGSFGCSSSSSSEISNRRIKRIANELRTAASTAEFSLRQLITGVDNLKMLASAIDSIDRISDAKIPSLSDDEGEDNARGPAF